jgi:hypothetical protein
MAADTPFLNPFFLHIGLTALGAYEGAPHVMHHTLFFHTRLTVLSCISIDAVGSRFAKDTLLLKLRQAQFERFICPFFIRDFLPRAGPQIMVLDILRNFRASIPMQGRPFNRLGSM